LRRFFLLLLFSVEIVILSCLSPITLYNFLCFYIFHHLIIIIHVDIYLHLSYLNTLTIPLPLFTIILSLRQYEHLHLFTLNFLNTLTSQGTAKVQQLFTLRGKLKSQGTIAGLYVQTGNMKAGGTGAGTFKGSEYTYR
jgi:hypothetical protein